MKCRFAANQNVGGMKILEIVCEATNYRQVKYRVFHPCGHESIMTGNAIVQRLHNMKHHRSTNLCPPCAKEWGKENTRKTAEKKAKTRNSPDALTFDDAIALFRSSLL